VVDVNMIENIRISLRGLRGNKLRSSLTVLGILIGVGAVIILVAVGNGSSAAVQSQIKALGTNTVTVMSTGRFGRGPATTGTQAQSATLTEADVKLLEDPNQAPDVLTASPVVSTSETATYSSATSSITVTGTTSSYLAAEGYSLEAGRNLSSADVSNHTLDVVVGQTLVSDLFTAGTNPIGQQIQMGASQWTIVGVLASKGSTGTVDENAVAIVPYTSAEDQLTGYTASFSELIVESKNSHDVDAAEAETETILASANKTTVADLPFRLLNESSLLQTSQSTNETFTVLLGAVAAISLLVGGIGIMNIMLVTVTERTREIGIRKAIGAPKGAILAQFLTEAVILSFMGGLAGVAVGLIGSHFKIVGIKPVVSGTSIIEAFAVAIAIGVFFGFYPANRAASMRPIDALRYE
jgi:putative ABC transport system permease protein